MRKHLSILNIMRQQLKPKSDTDI